MLKNIKKLGDDIDIINFFQENLKQIVYFINIR